MAKYIDREALIEWLKRIPIIDLSDGRGLCRVIMEDDFKKAIKKMPKGIIADVEPARHGRWKLIGADKRGRGGVWECTGRDGCGRLYPYKCDYCPNCGAKMDEEGTHER